MNGAAPALGARGAFVCEPLSSASQGARVEARRPDGGVPEWLKGTDCKSVGFAYVGSNPTPSTIFGCWWRLRSAEPASTIMTARP